MFLLGKFIQVYWTQLPKEDRAKRLKKEDDNSRIKQLNKGTYRQTQNLMLKQDSGSLDARASRNISGLWPSDMCLLRYK